MTETKQVFVGVITGRDSTPPTASLSTTAGSTITIPRDGRSVDVSFSTTVSDASGISSVMLLRTNVTSSWGGTVQWPSNFSTTNGRNCLLATPCTQRATVPFTIADIGKTIQVSAIVIDGTGNFTVTRVLSFLVTQEGSVIDRTAPTGSLTATPASFILSNDETGTVSLRATLADNIQLKDIRFYRTNPLTGIQETLSTLLTMTSAGVECNTGRNSCTVNFSTLIPGAFAGNSVAYYAIVHDTTGNETRTASANVRVAARTTTTNTTTVPTITFSTSKTSMTASQTATLNASATSNGGVYAVEIRALPSWTTTVTKKRCTLSGGPRTGTCSLDIGPYIDRTSGTIKVWAIAWDSTSGLGGNSGEKTITITR